MYMYKGFMRYGWNKNNHKALCVPFIRQYSVVKGLRNYSLELRTTHYAHVCIYLFIDSFIFFGLRWWIYMFVKWAALPLPKFIKWAYIPLPPCRQIWGDKTRNILWTVDKFSWLSFFILENLIENTFSSRVVEGRNKDKLTCLSMFVRSRRYKHGQTN